MSLVDDITTKLASKLADNTIKLAEKKGGEYFDDLIEQGDEALDALPEEYRGEAKDALDIMEGIKTPLLRLTNVGLARLLGHWQSNDKAEARRFYLEHQATYLERRAAVHAATDGLVDGEDARQAAWDAVEAALKKIGIQGLKFLGGLALKAVGIPI